MAISGLLLSTISSSSKTITSTLVLIKFGLYMATTETVHDRIEFATDSLTPTQMVLGLGLTTLMAVLVLFAQEPLVHDAMHNFRHTAGVACH